MDRREFLQAALPAAAGAALVMPHWATAAKAKGEEITVTPIADRIFLICGGGGNVTVFNSSEGVLMVDGGSHERSSDVLRAVKKGTGSSKVHTLFNTHWHWDQTGSNEKLGKSGTRIVSHENTKLWLGTEINSKWEKRVYEPLPREALPTKTTYTKDTLNFGGEQIEYGYLGQAHTDGDIYVYFRNANVLVASDVVSVGAYPIIDYSTNGWIGGMVSATQTLLDLSNDDTKIVPGRGSVATKANLKAENAMLATLRPRLAKLLAQGMSVEDMINAAPTREFDDQWGDPKLFIANAWPGLVARSRELGVSIVQDRSGHAASRRVRTSGGVSLDETRHLRHGGAL